MIKTAEELYEKKDYYNALEWYEKAYEEREDESLLPTIAELQLKLRDYQRAERIYARLLRRDEDNQYADLRLPYGRALKMNGKYREAVEELQKFADETTDPKLKELAETEITGAELGMNMPPRSTKGIEVENMGRRVNAAFSEYSAVPYRDGSLYFGGYMSKEVIYLTDSSDLENYARILRTTYNEKRDRWEDPSALGREINVPGYHTSNVTFSKDGNRMFFTRAKLQGNVMETSKIYYCLGGDGNWGAPQEVVGINGDYIATHPAVGELFGKEVLFFASDRPGGYGGLDLYYATVKGEGVYGDPVNLGPRINTPNDEVTPFYYDGTLYFSSDGHPSVGGQDIFFTVWDGTSWSDPENMGAGFNTSADDRYFALDNQGLQGYLLSNREGGSFLKSRTCCDDIYTFTIPERYVDLIVGVFDTDKEPVTGANVTVFKKIGTKREPAGNRVNPDGNRFDFPLEFDVAYEVIASAEGYFPDTTALNTMDLRESKTFKEFLYLKPEPKPEPEPEFDTITIEEAIVLENILYDFDSDRIKEEAETDLELVYELMNDYPDMVIELRSHTDYRGDNAYNVNLSQRRAESARRWLVRKGLPVQRIEAKGYGETVPQTVNRRVASQYNFLDEGDVLTPSFIDNTLTTEEQREIAHRINRRTEFKILEGPTTITVKRTRLRKQNTEKEAPNRNLLPRTDTAVDDSTIVIHELSSLYGREDLTGLPILQFDQRVIDFGTVGIGQKREHTYKVTNVGDTEAVISIITACYCTTIDYPKGRLAPGESSEIHIVFDSTSKREDETINIDIILENVEPDTDNPIIERLQYSFQIAVD